MEAIICDGAVRSGKTLSMGLGFFLWACSSFRGARFGICGKTIASLRRNVLTELLPKLQALGFAVSEKRTENLVRVTYQGRSNDFYVFGGRDESSAALIQGITFAGILLDEVALMPRSFVEQACARCSVSGSRLWFNCNPEGRATGSITSGSSARSSATACICTSPWRTTPRSPPPSASAMSGSTPGYSTGGSSSANGSQRRGASTTSSTRRRLRRRPAARLSAGTSPCDYGTVNPASFGLWGLQNGVWYRVREFYFDSRREMRQMTDAEYADALAGLAGERRIEAVVVDPSAASFLSCWAARLARPSEPRMTCSPASARRPTCSRAAVL